MFKRFGFSLIKWILVLEKNVLCNYILRKISLSVFLFFFGNLSWAGLSNLKTEFLYLNSEHQSLSDEINEFLSQFPLIRVGISAAVGSGHQAAGAMVVQRLREIGYQGYIEVIYDLEDTANKLIYLLPPFKGFLAGQVQDFPELKIKFIYGGKGFEQFRNSKAEYIPLAIMGASDDLKYPVGELKAESLLMLQPMDWTVAPALKVRYGLQFPPAIELPQFKKLGFIFQPPNPKDVNAFLKIQLSHDFYKDKYTFLSTLMSQMNTRDILPVYGHGVRNVNDQLECLIESLVVGGIKEPQAYKNGIVIPIINDISRLRWRGDEDRIKELKKNISVKLSHPDFPVELYKYDDPALVNLLKIKNDKRIILVDLREIPKPVFELLYFKETLPGIVEGRNSINYMKLIGKPYLPSIQHESFTFLEEVRGNPTVLGQTTLMAWSELSNHSNFLGRGEPTDNLEEFYLQASLHPNLVSDFFMQYKQNENLIESEDKLLLGLKQYKIELKVLVDQELELEKLKSEKSKRFLKFFIRTYEVLFKKNKNKLADFLFCADLFK